MPKVPAPCRWPPRDVLVERFVAYGTTHGAWSDAPDHSEGGLVRIGAGDLLLFDDLVLAHGRDGCRAPAELGQWVFGHRRRSAGGQLALRTRRLDAMARQP